MKRLPYALVIALCAALWGCSSEQSEPTTSPPVVAQSVAQQEAQQAQTMQAAEQQPEIAQQQEQELPDFAVQSPVSAVLLDYSLHESLVNLVGGGWRCLLHEEPEQWLVFQRTDGDDSWSVNVDTPWQVISGGEYQVVMPGPATGVIGACLRVGADVDQLWVADREQRDERARASAAQRELETLKRPVPVDWQEVTINPTPPAAYCEDNPFDLFVSYQEAVAGHRIRLAIHPRNDGVIWVAVEDDALWPTACHVYSTEWERNPETGWYHSGPISVWSR